MKIALANDHAVASMHNDLVEYLIEGNHEVLDFGTDSDESIDYPDVARQAVEAVLDGRADLAIVACGTGIGVSMTANKFRGIRCALCIDEYSSRLAREHNNANVLALRGRRMEIEQNLRIIDAFLSAKFLGDRHQRRLDKLTEIENKK